MFVLGINLTHNGKFKSEYPTINLQFLRGCFRLICNKKIIRKLSENSSVLASTVFPKHMIRSIVALFAVTTFVKFISN